MNMKRVKLKSDRKTFDIRKNMLGNRPNKTDLDFYTHNAVEAIGWMQDAFKTEQR